MLVLALVPPSPTPSRQCYAGAQTWPHTCQTSALPLNFNPCPLFAFHLRQGLTKLPRQDCNLQPPASPLGSHFSFLPPSSDTHTTLLPPSSLSLRPLNRAPAILFTFLFSLPIKRSSLMRLYRLLLTSLSFIICDFKSIRTTTFP